MLLLNAFSANMIGTFPVSVMLTEIAVEEARVLAKDCASAVGHADTAAVFGEILGTPVPMARVTVALATGDRALLGQYSGPRLPEGATSLPTGATIKWILVEVK